MLGVMRQTSVKVPSERIVFDVFRVISAVFWLIFDYLWTLNYSKMVNMSWIWFMKLFSYSLTAFISWNDAKIYHIKTFSPNLEFCVTYISFQVMVILFWPANLHSPEEYLSNEGSHDILWSQIWISKFFGGHFWYPGKGGGLGPLLRVPTKKFWLICHPWPQWPLHANLLRNSCLTSPPLVVRGQVLSVLYHFFSLCCD